MRPPRPINLISHPNHPTPGIPRGRVPGPAEAHAVVNDWPHPHETRGANTDVAASAVFVDPDQMLLPRLGRNIRAGFRLAFMRPITLEGFRVDFGQIVALFIVVAMLAVITGYFTVAPPRRFFMYGLTSWATHQLIFIAGVLLVSAWLGRPEQRSTLFVILLSASAVIELVTLPLSVLILRELMFDQTPWAYWAYFALIVVWAITAAGRAMRLTSESSRLKVALPLAGYALVVYGMLFVIPSSQIWYTAPTQSSASSRPSRTFIDPESTYYDQPRLLSASFDRLEPERPGVSDLYFVGFANYGHQDVFRKEIELVHALMDERFDTRGRSLTLINNADTVDEIPLANRPNLARALQAIGERMNVDEDVLFLFLTSHGSSDGVLAASLWPLRPNDLSATDLRQALDDSGIRFRILVVSACYSGSFIDTLKDDHTLILTASRKDRNSFGCSDDRELTYFGEHFFAQELKSGKPLLDAFSAAQVTLAEREKAEGFTPSEPQIFIGDKIQAKLAEVEARLTPD